MRRPTEAAALLGLLCTLAWSGVTAALGAQLSRPPVASPPAELEHYRVGDPDAPTPDAVAPGLLLMGGGQHDDDAMQWFLNHAGHGHIVVLRASQSTDVADEIYRQRRGAVSVDTFVFHSRRAARDPAMLAAVASADGIYIAGGDQSRYVKYWKNTGVARLLDAHVAAGKPLAGTSAGLAILGEYLFSARTPATVTSELALADPMGRDITIDTDFLHFAVLRSYITDSHVDQRRRLGRLVVFVSRANAMHSGKDGVVEGLGIDEDTALAVSADGEAQVFSRNADAGTSWVHGVEGSLRAGRPLETGPLFVTDLGPQSTFNLLSHRATAVRAERVLRVVGGQLQPQ